MGGLGFIRIGVWQNFIRAWKSGYQGNMNGEGFILGGVYVIGAGEQVFDQTHRYGSTANKSPAVFNNMFVFFGRESSWSTVKSSLEIKWTQQMF